MRTTLTRTLHAGDSRRKGQRPLRRRRSEHGRLPRPGIAEPFALSDAGSGCPAAWEGAPAAEFGSAAAGLTQPLVLPLLTPDLPRVLSIPGDVRRPALLAEALLAEGILQETDWCGSLAMSINLGIQRWAGEALCGDPTALAHGPDVQCSDLDRIELCLNWMDDVARPRLIGEQHGQVSSGAGFDTQLWLQAQPGRKPGEPVGMLAIVRKRVGSDRYPVERDCFVGRTVRELETVRSGLGFQVLNLLQEVLPPLVNAATPHYGYSQVFKYDWLLKQAGSAARLAQVVELPRHGLTLDEYLEHVPIEACVGEYRPGVIREALRHPLPADLRAIVAQAWELETLRKAPRDVFRCDAALFLANSTRIQFMDCPGGAAKESSFTLRWSADDPLPRIVDDYHYQIRSRDTETDLLWCQGFQLSDERALRKTVRNWKTAVTIALRACALAESMHRDEGGS